MRQIASLVPIALCVVIAGAFVPALAQSERGNGDSFTLGDYGAKERQKPPKPLAIDQDPSLIHRQAERWPWLEPGTVVCRTQDDLARYRAAVAARLNGEVSAAPIGECRRLSKRTPIDIADRHGPATTEIRLYNDANQTAWTDVWLPNQRPN
jgi:hypothetical protein